MADTLISVVLAVIYDESGRVLLTRRGQHQHLPGKWEFPGGKIEPDELQEQALARELEEELGITPLNTDPLIYLEHHYSDRHVTLNVFEVHEYIGEAEAREGQEMQWCPIQELVSVDFPEANEAVLMALRLPESYLITPEPEQNREQFLHRLDQVLSSRLHTIKLVQFRAPALLEADYMALATQVAKSCKRHDAKLLLNADPECLSRVGADGVHLNSRRLMELRHRPMGSEYLVAASCHNIEELQQAEEIGVDFVVLSPVCLTPSHSEAKALGWQTFQTLCSQVNLPVYALGGMQVDDIKTARITGGQGIAAIRGLWHI